MKNSTPNFSEVYKINLKKLAQDAVLLYPLILNDRLELILVTPYAPPIRRTVPVKQEELNRAIAEFRLALTNPTSNENEPTQKLYTWLIQPIEAALTETNHRYGGKKRKCLYRAVFLLGIFDTKCDCIPCGFETVVCHSPNLAKSNIN